MFAVIKPIHRCAGRSRDIDRVNGRDSSPAKSEECLSEKDIRGSSCNFVD